VCPVSTTREDNAIQRPESVSVRPPHRFQDLVETECQRWKSKGVNIKYEVRGNRKGYKAGALKEGLKHDYVADCEYIAMFDADFQPDSDFLLRTIPFLVHNPEIALVQARWKFG
jgi:beta-mannan synthase